MMVLWIVLLLGALVAAFMALSGQPELLASLGDVDTAGWIAAAVLSLYVVYLLLGHGGRLGEALRPQNILLLLQRKLLRTIHLISRRLSLPRLLKPSDPSPRENLLPHPPGKPLLRGKHVVRQPTTQPRVSLPLRQTLRVGKDRLDTSQLSHQAVPPGGINLGFPFTYTIVQPFAN